MNGFSQSHSALSYWPLSIVKITVS